MTYIWHGTTSTDSWRQRKIEEEIAEVEAWNRMNAHAQLMCRIGSQFEEPLDDAVHIPPTPNHGTVMDEEIIDRDSE